MTAAVRTATADTATLRTELEGRGTVEVNGSAEATTTACRMGPPRFHPDAVPSPRQALANHFIHLAKLAANHERTSRPVDRLRGQLSQATGDLQRAEAALAQVDAKHSAAIATAARLDNCSVEPVESSAAEAAIARARRNVNSIRQALEECSQDQVRAAANLESAKAAFDGLALRIFVSEHDARLEHWAKARDAYHVAEITLLSLHAFMGEHGRDMESKAPGAGIPWLSRLESLREPWDISSGHIERGGPREINQAAARWAAVLAKLKTDPDATF
jgi:hypothetical protein